MSKNEEIELRKLLEETKELAKENNKMLRSVRRIGMIEFVMRIAWYLILVGIPFAVYFYVLEPYLAAIGISYSKLSEDVQALPVIKALGIILGL